MELLRDILSIIFYVIAVVMFIILAIKTIKSMKTNEENDKLEKQNLLLQAEQIKAATEYWTVMTKREGNKSKIISDEKEEVETTKKKSGRPKKNKGE